MSHALIKTLQCSAPAVQHLEALLGILLGFTLQGAVPALAKTAMCFALLYAAGCSACAATLLGTLL